MKELRTFLENESKDIGLKILKFSIWHSESNNTNLDILIEKEDNSPTDLNDCSKINKLALLWLKNNNLLNKTNLSVRVPGIDRELFSPQDFARFVGEKVQIELKELTKDRKRIKGFIKSVECDLITLESDSNDFQIQWDLIEKASIIPDWDKIMKLTKIKKK
jgi:ribosome maturation factor RimP